MTECGSARQSASLRKVTYLLGQKSCLQSVVWKNWTHNLRFKRRSWWRAAGDVLSPGNLESRGERHFFRIEAILKQRLTPRGQREFLVKWYGYPTSFNSWILQIALSWEIHRLNSPTMIEEDQVDTALNDNVTRRNRTSKEWQFFGRRVPRSEIVFFF